MGISKKIIITPIIKEQVLRVGIIKIHNIHIIINKTQHNSNNNIKVIIKIPLIRIYFKFINIQLNLLSQHNNLNNSKFISNSHINLSKQHTSSRQLTNYYRLQFIFNKININNNSNNHHKFKCQLLSTWE